MGQRVPIANLAIDRDKVAAFCRKWKIEELSLFGSVLREDFGPASDVDVLVAFHPEARWTLLDMVDMQDELSALMGRKVDLVSRRGVESSRNRPRRREILENARPVYVAPHG
ncbi:MAG: nucleotidyltransferase family protein [Bdellovibrionota bacterium]